MRIKTIGAKNAINKSAKNDKKTEKQSSKPPFTISQALAVIVVFIICLWAYIFLVHFPIEEEERIETEIAFQTEYIDDPGMERGEEKIEQEGIVGRAVNVWKVKRKGLLARTKQDRYLDHSERITSPTKQIIRRGTRKWQYMICSDGSYRYYDDEIFKNTDAGFTHVSPDFCEKNNQGTMVRLADQPPVRNNSTNYYSSYIPRPTYISSYVPSNSSAPESTAKYETSTLNQWSPSGSTNITVQEGQCYVHRDGVYRCQ